MQALMNGNNFMKRFWLYQAERFPLATQGLLIIVFAFCGLSFSNMVRQATVLEFKSILVATVVALLFFLQLRIIDEFKDNAEDCQYRPYRPVPRGLVSLRELAYVSLCASVVQFFLTLWLNGNLIWLLLCVWAFMFLMSKDFFVSGWLKSQPAAYMLSHMIILPVVDIYITACDWLPTGSMPPYSFMVFFAVSFFNGVVMEIGRKLRAPVDEEVGVQTYSALWGANTGSYIWLMAIVATTVFAFLTASIIDFSFVAAAILLPLLSVGILLRKFFLLEPVRGAGHHLDSFSGLWVAAVYLSLGALPLIASLGKTVP